MPGDVLDDQRRLGRALERARAGEDRELAGAVRDHGLRLVRLMYGMVRMSRVHASDNAAFDRPIEELTEVLAELVELLGVVHLVAVEDQVYVNDIRIRFQERGEGAGELGMEFRLIGVGGISFHVVPTLTWLRVLSMAFARPPVGVTHRAELEARLKEVGADAMELHGPFRFRLSGEEERQQAPKRDARRVASRAALAVDEAWDSMLNNRVPNPLPLRRAVTELLSVGEGVDGLWEDPRGASPLSGHTLRVTRYALLLARALKLSEEAIQDLGVAAMFHDLGYAAREGVVAPTDDDPGDPGYAPPYERHASAGARLLLRQRGFHEAKIRRALASLEHHDDARSETPPTLFARVIRVCEDYDNLIRRRGRGLPPTQALAHIAGGAGRRYDPVVVQAFVNAMGLFPPGTVLELEDRRIVRVVSVARSPKSWARPLCRTEVGADGKFHAGPPAYVDLALEGKVVRELPHP